MEVSKIIQKEKEEQECWLKGCELLIEEPESGNYECGITKTVSRDDEYIHYCFHCNSRMAQHKRFLINLKEDMEEIEEVWGESGNCGCNDSHDGFYEKISRDIQELNKMIGRYG